MRDCLVCSDAACLMGKPTGGAEKHVGVLARHFARRGRDVTLVALDHVLVRSCWGRGQGPRSFAALRAECRPFNAF